MHLFTRSVLLAAMSVAFAPALFSDVVLQRKPTAPNTPWLPTFGEGALSVGLLPAAGDAVGEMITGKNLCYFAQSIQGDGRVLEAVAFYGHGSSPQSDGYTLTLLDYGVSAPLNTPAAFNPEIPSTVVFSETFSLSYGSPAQLYFDFRGASRVPLLRDHAYVIMIATSGESGCMLHRLTGPDSTYAGGTAAKGLISLSPESFAGPGALRDALFALYTAER